MDEPPLTTEDPATVARAVLPVLAQPARWRAAVHGHVGGLPGPFWWIWLGTLVNRAGTFIEPFFVLYLTGPRHVSIQTTGLVLTVWGFGSLLSQPIGGVLTDRLGRRATLATSLTATALALLALSLARGLGEISVLVLVLGAVADMYRPAASAAVADLVAEPDRIRAYALQFWAVNLGFSVAATSAGLLLHLGFGLLFVLDAGTTFAFGMIALRFIPETRPQTEHAPARLGDPLRLFRADRLLLAATALVLVYAVLYAQVNIILPLAIRHIGLSASVYGYVIAVNGVLIVLGQPLTLGLLARTPRRYSLPFGMALVGVGVGATSFCHASWQFGLTVVVWSVGEIATAGSFQALIASLAPAHMRGRYAGTLGLAWGAAALLGPLLGASGYAASPELTSLGCLLAGLVAAAGQYWLIGAIDRRLGSDVAASDVAASDVEAEGT